MNRVAAEHGCVISNTFLTEEQQKMRGSKKRLQNQLALQIDAKNIYKICDFKDFRSRCSKDHIYPISHRLKGNESAGNEAEVKTRVIILDTLKHTTPFFFL